MRILIWIFIFYLLYRLVKSFMRSITGGKPGNYDPYSGNNSSSGNPDAGNSAYRRGNGQGSERKKYKIDKKDVVEARFEEIKDETKKTPDEENDESNRKKNSGEDSSQTGA